MLGFVWALLVGLAQAVVPGALPERASTSDEPVPLKFISVTPRHQRECTQPGLVCFYAPLGATLRASVLYGTSFGKIPIFFRKPPFGQKLSAVPWELEVVANLKQKNLPGTVLILVYDQEDPQAIANHEVTAMWEAKLDAFRTIAMRVRIDPEGMGFNPTHIYLFRVVQILAKREVVLAQGNVRLE